jgi:DNA repair protein SbcC/Rad50
MKILTVRFRNLNSLRKEKTNDFFEINFQHSPLKEAGLFAITGATGAGKSTILDALTLALYGTAPRFGSGKAYEIMSRDTSDCFSAVEFEVENKQYTCKWGLSKKIKKNKEIDYSEKMELAEVGGTILEANKITEVKKLVEQITGLDYQRFLRSVMLSQGDFSAFLKADEKGRGELLEKITGTEIYSLLSKRADEKRFEAKKMLENIENQIDESKLLSEEQKNEIVLQIADLQARNIILSKDIEIMSKQKTELGEMNRLSAQLSVFQGDLQKIQREQENAIGDFANLAKHERATLFSVELSEIEMLTKALDENLQEINNLNMLIPSLRQEKEAKEKQVLLTREMLAKAEKEQEEVFPLIEQVEKLDFQLQELVKELDKMRKEIGEQGQQLGVHEQGKAKILQVIERQKADLKEVIAYLTLYAPHKTLAQDLGTIKEKIDHVFELGREVKKLKEDIENNKHEILREETKAISEKANLEKYKKEVLENKANQAIIQQEIALILQGKTLDSQEELYIELLKKLESYKQLHDISLEFVRLTKELQTLQESSMINTQEEGKLRFFLKELFEKQQHTEEKLRLAKELFEKEKLIQSFEQSRKDLKVGEPCPVCGSEHHPFADYHTEVDEKEQQFIFYEKELKSIRDKIRATEISSERLKVTLESQKKQVADNQTTITHLQNDFRKYAGMLSSEIVIEDSQNLKAQLDKKEAEAAAVNEQNKRCAEKENQLHKLEKVQKEQEEKCQTIEKQLIKIDSLLLSLHENRQRLENACVQNVEKGKKAKSSLVEILSVYNEQLPLEVEKENWFTKLTDKAQDYQKMLEKEALLGKRIEEEKGNEKRYLALIEGIHLQLKKLRENEQKTQANYTHKEKERKTLFGDKHTQKEKKRVVEAVKNGQTQEKSLAAALSQLNEQLNMKLDALGGREVENTKKQDELAQKQGLLMEKIILADFHSLSEVSDSLLSNETVTKIKRHKENLEKQAISLNANILQTEKLLFERREHIGEAATKDILALTQDLEKCEQEKKENTSNSTEFTFRLRENENLEKQFAEKRREVAKQRQEFEKWKILVDIIGSKTTNELRSFAQSLTLSQLILLANKHLDKVNPRYHLQKKEKTELEMSIIDREQADSVRSISTLSGGETFLVSLALALGLSDLATMGKQTQIQSLFIDEGFGTLDPRTLDETITTLENLQLGGKQIGIISHVEELKLRITTQIQVSKKGNGVSQIAVIG